MICIASYLAVDSGSKLSYVFKNGQLFYSPYKNLLQIMDAVISRFAFCVTVADSLQDETLIKLGS
jgi:hypothetical protein